MNKYPGTSDGYPFPDGLGVRIPGFHPGGPGSIPGLGASFPSENFSEKLPISVKKRNY